jgi:hypothetical protein
LAFELPLRNSLALTNLIHDIYDPASPRFRKYLTPEEFTEMFGPTKEDYHALVAFVERNGLKVVGTHPNRLLLDVEGSVTSIENAIHVRMRTYQHPTEARQFYAPEAEPRMDITIPLLGISGLNNYSLPRPRIVSRTLIEVPNSNPLGGSGPGGTFMGMDFRNAYVPDTTLTGHGQSVGLLEFDGYTAKDILDYESSNGLTSVTLSNVLIDGFSGNPSGTGGEVEVALDIEVAIAMAPGLAKVIIYEAPNPSPFIDILNRMATDNQAKQLSCSWYIPNGGPNPAADQIWLQMAAQGQSFFNASGDNDAYTGLIDFPGDSPYITQVGGTTLATTGPGGGWVSETVWNWGGGIGSGGGISTSYSIPSWQTNISMTPSQGSTTKRNTPDVALTADKVYVKANGRNYNVGGTSCAAPLWAGLTALMNEQALASGRTPVGFINPAVYSIPNYSGSFHDITTGNNTSPQSPNKFFAVAGYDLCTGWGTPAGQALIDAVATPDALLIQPDHGFASFGKMGGPFDITTESFALTNAGTAPLQWTLVASPWLQASSYSGTIPPAALPTALTISLNSTASNLVAGNYTADVWFTNLTSGFRQSRRFTLQVVPSNMPPTIVTQPKDVSVFLAATAYFSVNATGTPPLRFHWTFEGFDIPDATNNNLTISNVQTNQAGNYAVEVSNDLGTILSSNAVLTVVGSGVGILLDVDFQGWLGVTTNNMSAKMGFAAIGQTSSDYWNFYQTLENNPSGAVPNLILADGTVTTAGLTVQNGPGSWGTGSPDAMYHEYIYPWGGDMVITFTNLPPGVYEVLPYGSVGNYDLSVGSVQYGNQQCYDSNPGGVPVWTQGVQYVVYTNVQVQAGQSLVLTVHSSGSGSLAGMQLAKAGIAGIAPVITQQPTNQTVSVGSAATFSVTATGSTPLSYRWQKNGISLSDGGNIWGSTTTSLTISNAQSGDAANYSVVVSNSISSVASSNAVLTVFQLGQMTWRFNNGAFEIHFYGKSGDTYYMEGSPDLLHWFLIGPAAETSNGNFVFSDAYWNLRNTFFYRIWQP